ncbi:MAG: ArgR family transcriptional regulator [Gammaproteobacteria bacterium]|nr:ArgR family transcriptional regulator [Gammaproteobacteria bacterium]
MPIANEAMQKRQQAILAILRSRRVERQSELVRLLKERGIRVTQSSVSRDLQQLGIAKLESGYRRVEQPDPETDRDAALLAEFVRDIRAAGGNLTVVKTAEGAAQRVALYLDRSGWAEIVGTVSGDDTIFVATRNGGEQKRLLARLRALVAHAARPVE